MVDGDSKFVSFGSIKVLPICMTCDLPFWSNATTAAVPDCRMFMSDPAAARRIGTLVDLMLKQLSPFF